MSKILSQYPGLDVNRTTVTIVKPPLVATLKVRDPASRYCEWVLSKLTWPLPFGPPAALYVGTVPIAALFLVEIDANEGLGVSAMNLVEYGKMIFCGLLLSPQQSTDVVVPDRALNPVGQAVQTDAALIFENVSAGHTPHAAGPETLLAAPAAHATHGPTSGPEYPGLQEQALTLVLPTDEFAFVVQFVHAPLPFVDLYVPGGHKLHCPFEAPVSGPVYPVLHGHLVPSTQFGGCTSAT